MSRERPTIPPLRELAAAARECPLAPPAHATVYARALHRACLVLGGLQQLSDHLEATQADLRRWMRAEEDPPERIFLAVVEILLLHAAATGRTT